MTRGSLSNLYLFIYNSAQAFGWYTYISFIPILASYNFENCRETALFKLLVYFSSTKSVNVGYASAGELICLLQTIGFIEVLHGALGIVPSGFLFPLMQWGGRTHFLLAVVRQINEVQDSPAVFIAFLAWCCMELDSLLFIPVFVFVVKHSR